MTEAVDEARSRARRIRVAVGEWVAELSAAWAGRDWEALDYRDWGAYLRGEFGDMQFTVEQRSQAEEMLHAAGMSTRAIAATTGQSQSTVSDHLNTHGSDVTGNRSRRDDPQPEQPQVVIDSRGRVQPASRPPVSPLPPPAPPSDATRAIDDARALAELTSGLAEFAQLMEKVIPRLPAQDGPSAGLLGVAYDRAAQAMARVGHYVATGQTDLDDELSSMIREEEQ